MTVTAIIRYDVDGALRIWSSLASVVGVLTGAIVAYFFTRGTVAAPREKAARAQEEVDAARKRADDRLKALVAAAGQLDKDLWSAMAENPLIARALQDD